ncbi:SCP-2 sterol transfer family protein, partial [Teladorsagia circumcincta]
MFENEEPTGAAEELESGIRKNWDEITNMKDAKNFESMREVMTDLMGIVADAESKANESGHSVQTSTASEGFPSHIKCSPLFQEMDAGVKEDPASVKNVKAIILYILTDGEKEIGKFTLDFKSTSPSVYFGDVKNGEKATVTVTVSDDDFLEIASGKLNPQK